MNTLNRQSINTKRAPIKVIQFGEGNFLRAFVNYAFQKLNDEQNFNAGIAVVQPIEHGLVSLLNEQDGLYTLFLNGIKNGKEIKEKKLITNITKAINPYTDFNSYLELAKEESLEFIISNTTEAGITFIESDTIDMSPPSSFPAKLTKLLYERFLYFKGNPSKGLSIIPCELINYNAKNLKQIIFKYITLWSLDNDFKSWIEEHNSFHNTLVDRIVPGYPKEEIEKYNAQLAYKDKLIVTAESFFLWVIEGDEKLKEKLPFHLTNLDVKIVENMQPYRTRKVRILNGSHTTMVPFSILYGNKTVKSTLDNSFSSQFVKDAIFNEIIPTLDMDKKELEEFANDVLDRFRNPEIKHQLASIALNSISKFKVRVLPSLVHYIETQHKIPVNLTFAFACLIQFYKGVWNNEKLPLNDDPKIIEDFNQLWKNNNLKDLTKKILSKEIYWDRNLNELIGLELAVLKALTLIDEKGIEKGYKEFKQDYYN